MGTLSSNNNCIGSYNSKGLSPANSCAPSATTPQFLTGGTLDGFITLEDADSVIIAQLKQSLCFYLSGATTGPTDANGNSLCPRDANNNITYQPTAADGGWCSTTNTAETASCDDSLKLAAAFAASSVKINN
jgi:hypothetical protein